MCEMLFCTSLVAQVGSGDQPNLSPRRLHLINTKRQSVICELNFNSAILGVKLNRKRVVIILEEQIHIYDISTMKSLHIIDIPPNPKGLLVLSPFPRHLPTAILTLPSFPPTLRTLLTVSLTGKPVPGVSREPDNREDQHF